jgi:hypothetical protein
MTRMIMDARQPFDDASDARQSPEIRVKTVSPRALAQSPLDPLPLGRTQFRLPAGPAGAAQGFGPAPLPLFVPPTDALAAHLEVSSNGGQDPLPRREQARGTLAPLFQSPKISPWTIGSSHTISIYLGSVLVTILCEAQ